MSVKAGKQGFHTHLSENNHSGRCPAEITASPLGSKGQPREEVALCIQQHPANTEQLSGGPAMVFSFELSINSKQVFTTQTPGIIKVNEGTQNTHPQCWCHSFPIPTAFQKRSKLNAPDETQNE